MLFKNLPDAFFVFNNGRDSNYPCSKYNPDLDTRTVALN